MARFRVSDLMVSLVMVQPGEPSAVCGLSLCRGVSLLDSSDAIQCIDPSLIGCGISICARITRCMGATLVDGCDGGQSDFSKGCRGNGTTCAMPDPALQLRELAVLKEQLRQTLARVEQGEQLLKQSEAS
jgi:hypothetical protein